VKNYNYIFLLVLCFCLLSCESLPDGVAPAGPIVEDQGIENPVLDGKDAANYMVTSLATKCQPIANAVAGKPVIINDFVIFDGKVNDLQMGVWQRLAKMNMIIPVSDISYKPGYRLTGKIDRLPEKTKNSRQQYLWTMILVRLDGGEVVWNEKVEFVDAESHSESR